MLKDSVIEVASPGIGIGRQTLVQLARRRRAGRRRRQLDLNISDCGEPGSDVFYDLEAARRRCQKVSPLGEGKFWKSFGIKDEVE